MNLRALFVLVTDTLRQAIAIIPAQSVTCANDSDDSENDHHCLDCYGAHAQPATTPAPTEPVSRPVPASLLQASPSQQTPSHTDLSFVCPPTVWPLGQYHMQIASNAQRTHLRGLSQDVRHSRCLCACVPASLCACLLSCCCVLHTHSLSPPPPPFPPLRLIVSCTGMSRPFVVDVANTKQQQ